MEFKGKLLMSIFIVAVLFSLTESRKKFRSGSAKSSHHRALSKSKVDGNFCDLNCVAVFEFPYTRPTFINKAEIDLADDFSCHSSRFDNPQTVLTLSHHAKITFPEKFHGIVANRNYTHGANYEQLKDHYSNYVRDLSLLYKTFDLEGLGRCYFGIGKAPEDPCSYTKVCGASFGGSSCVKYEGHCHSTCSACCFLEADADVIKIDSDFQDYMEEDFGRKMSLKKKAYFARIDYERFKKRSHHSKKQWKEGDKKEEVAPANLAAAPAVSAAASAAAAAVAPANLAAKAPAAAAPAVDPNVKNVIGKDANAVGGGTPPGEVVDKEAEKVVKTLSEIKALEGSPKRGIGYRADALHIGTKKYFDKCELASHVQDCRDGKCENSVQQNAAANGFITPGVLRTQVHPKKTHKRN